MVVGYRTRMYHAPKYTLLPPSSVRKGQRCTAYGFELLDPHMCTEGMGVFGAAGKVVGSARLIEISDTSKGQGRRPFPKVVVVCGEGRTEKDGVVHPHGNSAT